MSVVDEYLSSLNEPEKSIIKHMYSVAYKLVPDATYGISYGMPALQYKGKSLAAIMANAKFLSLYPFGAIEKLGLDFSAYECTSGSIHFSVDKPIPDDLLSQIVTARMRQIDTR